MKLRLEPKSARVLIALILVGLAHAYWGSLHLAALEERAPVDFLWVYATLWGVLLLWLISPATGSVQMQGLSACVYVCFTGLVMEGVFLFWRRPKSDPAAGPVLWTHYGVHLLMGLYALWLMRHDRAAAGRRQT